MSAHKSQQKTGGERPGITCEPGEMRRICVDFTIQQLTFARVTDTVLGSRLKGGAARNGGGASLHRPIA